MTTQEHAAQDHTSEGNSAVALGYAVIAITGMFVGLFIAWLV